MFLGFCGKEGDILKQALYNVTLDRLEEQRFNSFIVTFLLD